MFGILPSFFFFPPNFILGSKPLLLPPPKWEVLVRLQWVRVGMGGLPGGGKGTWEQQGCVLTDFSMGRRSVLPGSRSHKDCELRRAWGRGSHVRVLFE